jgi:hypothetical protein
MVGCHEGASRRRGLTICSQILLTSFIRSASVSLS